jgi:hypothetical protein
MTRRQERLKASSHSIFALLADTSSKQTMTLFDSISKYLSVNKLLSQTITEYLRISGLGNKMFQWEDKTIYCQGLASLGHQTAITQSGAGVPLAA